MAAPPGRPATGRPALLREASAAFADLGTFLPLVIGMLVLGSFDATAVLLGFGVFAVATGAFYARPIPAQPMKAVAALASTGSRGAEAAMARLRPPVFFMEKRAFEARLRRWPLAKLDAALDLLLEAELGAKSTGLPDQEIVERTALRIAGMAGR